MKNRILFVACFILILLTLSSCQSEKKIVAEPAPTLETVPTEAGTAQTPVPVLDPMPEETLVSSPEPETLDYASAYSSVIEKYRIAKQASVSSTGAAFEYDVSEWIEYFDHVGYALKDLDENGVPELIVAGISPTYDPGPVLFEVFTLENNTPVQLLISWARSRNFLLPDNRIYNEGSGGASSSGFVLFKVNGTTLQFLEGYWSSNSTDNTGSTMYHTSSDEGNPGFGNFDKYDYTMPAQEGFAIGQQLCETSCLPELTLIA